MKPDQKLHYEDGQIFTTFQGVPEVQVAWVEELDESIELAREICRRFNASPRSDPRNFYAVIGRLCGDDEDTVLTFKAESKEDAIAQFIESGKEIWGVTDDELAHLEANGEGFFINNVLLSSAPIHEV